MYTKFSLLLVDDEPNARYALRKLVEAHESVGACYEAEDGLQALQLLEQTPCDIVFLDIDLRTGANGITLAGEMAMRRPAPRIIFVTGHADYAADAFEVNAVDFVRKGAGELRVYRALNKAIQQIKLESKQEADPTLRLWAKSQDGDTRLINMTEIVWAEANAKKVFVYTSVGEAIEVSKTLEQLLTLLPAEQFMRVHKSFIVNLARIKLRIDYSPQAARLLMDNGAEIDVGRNYLPNLKRRFPQ
jgi:DNA-binding LytR/AlgR family response regulator